MIIMILELKYDIYAVGETEEECKENLLKGFQRYLKEFNITFGEWVANADQDLADYDNNMWTFLDEYYGVRTYDITKGYALSWE